MSGAGQDIFVSHGTWGKYGRHAWVCSLCYDGFRALPSHVCHHLQTPRTAARPSSLRSVPSGLPMTMAKTQKNAAVHANSKIAMLKKGDSVNTKIDMPTA